MLIVFTTGTMGELTRVVEIDKRKLTNKGNLFNKIQILFKEMTQKTRRKILLLFFLFLFLA